MGLLDDKVAVVTGGASGMGYATVRRFLDEGARVVAADVNQGRIAALASERDDAVRWVRADVAVEEEVAGLMATAMATYGRLDIVFNNAGVPGAFGPITQLHAEDWDYTFAVLVRGVFLGIKHAAAAMQSTGAGGAIINTASAAGFAGGMGPVAYSAAKAAVLNLTRLAATELAVDRVRVNAICPGSILTPLFTQQLGASSADLALMLPNVQPLALAGSPDHIASTVVFLASEESAFITGESILVDGGLMASGPDLPTRFRAAARSASIKIPLLDDSPVPDVGVSRGTTGDSPVTIRSSGGR